MQLADFRFERKQPFARSALRDAISFANTHVPSLSRNEWQPCDDSIP
jgi:hypothetical protein